MPITKKAARQHVICAYVDINFSDLASGSAAAAIQLPANAVVLSGYLDTLTAFNSATSDVLSVGDSGSATRYLSGSNIHATGTASLTRTGYQYTAQSDITVTWTGVGAAPTAGVVRLYVTYVVLGREQFSQG